MALQKPPVMASIFTFIGFAILMTLGTWQMQRLAWKEDLLAQIEAAYEAEPAPMGYTDITKDAHLTRTKVTGTYNHAQSFLLIPRTQDGAVGAHILTPLALQGGGYVLVNRGWIAQGQNEYAQPAGRQTLIGLLRMPDAPNAFTPENIPAEGVWYYPDLEAIQSLLGLDRLAPIVLYAESSTGDDFPIGHNQRPSPNNNHLGYALFWYSLGLALLVVFFLRFMRKGA